MEFRCELTEHRIYRWETVSFNFVKSSIAQEYVRDADLLGSLGHLEDLCVGRLGRLKTKVDGRRIVDARLTTTRNARKLEL